MTWLQSSNGMCAVFDQGWQYPAITEKFAASLMMSIKTEMPYQYIGFPWATVIDFKNRAVEKSVDEYLERLAECPLDSAQRRITVSQHISTTKRIEFFNKVGITDIFASHSTIENYNVSGIRIHPFPLFPVQVPDLDLMQEKLNIRLPRKYLYSFVGTYPEKGYISDIRKKIFDGFNDGSGIIIRRKEWHYEQIVYTKQINGVNLTEEFLKEQERNEIQYKEILANSTFSLCPSGSGPNTIRLWESIGSLSIPVVFTNNFRFPGEQSLWERACIILPEDITKPESIIERLRTISSCPESLASMRRACAELWLRYGTNNFVHDVKKLQRLI